MRRGLALPDVVKFLMARQAVMVNDYDMPGQSDDRRRWRFRSALIAGSMALVAAALGIATTIAVPLLPRTWAWTRDALAVWGIVGVLLILAIVLAAIAALRDGPDDVLTLTGVADELAVAVRNQWQAEAATRRLNDPPLQVS